MSMNCSQWLVVVFVSAPPDLVLRRSVSFASVVRFYSVCTFSASLCFTLYVFVGARAILI
jgi:hypothetical protein